MYDSRLESSIKCYFQNICSYKITKPTKVLRPKDFTRINSRSRHYKQVNVSCLLQTDKRSTSFSKATATVTYTCNRGEMNNQEQKTSGAKTPQSASFVIYTLDIYMRGERVVRCMCIKVTHATQRHLGYDQIRVVFYYRRRVCNCNTPSINSIMFLIVVL